MVLRTYTRYKHPIHSRLLLFVAVNDNPTTLYVSSASGSDLNSCTQRQPCYSLRRASELADAFDTILVAPGVYNATVLLKPVTYEEPPPPLLLHTTCGVFTMSRTLSNPIQSITAFDRVPME